MEGERKLHGSMQFSGVKEEVPGCDCDFETEVLSLLQLSPDPCIVTSSTAPSCAKTSVQNS